MFSVYRCDTITLPRNSIFVPREWGFYFLVKTHSPSLHSLGMLKNCVAAKGALRFSRVASAARFLFSQKRAVKSIEREGKAMKKIVALILALSMVFALCGCGGRNDTDVVGTEKDNSDPVPPQETNDSKDNKPKEEISEVIYDKDGIYIEYRGIYYDSRDGWISRDWMINLYIENNTDRDISTVVSELVCNGKYSLNMSNGLNKITSKTVFLSSVKYSNIINTDELKKYGIKHLDTVDVKLEIKDGSFSEVIATIPLSLVVDLDLP